MRFLDFIASRQTLSRDPLCDFSGIVAGSRGYLFARFRFSKDWSGCRKVAVFVYRNKEYPTALVNNQCEIPADVLAGGPVKVYLVGQHDRYRVTTEPVAFAVK